MAFVTGYTKNVCYNGILGAFQWHTWTIAMVSLAFAISEHLFGDKNATAHKNNVVVTIAMTLGPLQWHPQLANSELL
jgi:hypothetical protein